MTEIFKEYWYFLLSMLILNGALFLYLIVQVIPLKNEKHRQELMYFSLKCIVAGFSTDFACIFNLYIGSRIIYSILLIIDLVIAFLIIRHADSLPLYSFKDEE
ncbi:MAG: hypothetical protein ACI4WM_02530 [Erysipelotrichaceae bacterium]